MINRESRITELNVLVAIGGTFLLVIVLPILFVLITIGIIMLYFQELFEIFWNYLKKIKLKQS